MPRVCGGRLPMERVRNEVFQPMHWDARQGEWWGGMPGQAHRQKTERAQSFVAASWPWYEVRVEEPSACSEPRVKADRVHTFPRHLSSDDSLFISLMPTIPSPRAYRAQAKGKRSLDHERSRGLA